MCVMTELGFRWVPAITVGPVPQTWYAYERGNGEYRYSRMRDQTTFRALYAIRVTPKGPKVQGFYP